MKNIKLLYIDLFCGAGGTSTGVELAKYQDSECAKVIACVNHDANAIASHASNHPDALHFTEDIRTLELSPMIEHIKQMRILYPDALIALWASLECTNFSKAKGGKPRDADSRTLAEHLFRYIDAINPDYVQIENVEEFMSWGDLDQNGKPISRDKGNSYLKWVKNITSYGYSYDYRILNSANYGAYTSRKRFFGIFAKQGLPIVFPDATHAKNPEGGLFQPLEKWRAVREVLDLNDVGRSIFFRDKALAENTLKRIYAGLIKFVAGGKDKWILKYNSMNKNGVHIPPSIDEPCPTVACQGRLGIASVERNTHFLSKYYTGNPESKNISIDGPAGTVTTIDHHSFISAYYSGDNHNHSLKEPCPTVLTKDRFAFISAYYGNGHNHALSAPCPTVTTKDRFCMVTSKFLDMQYGNGTASSVSDPAPTVTTTPKHNLVSVNRFLMNPQFKSKGGSVDKPCFTLIARMDKMPPYLVSVDEEVSNSEYCDSDTPAMREIKAFMQMYRIADIKMRMLKVQELKEIMGFPADYTLIGTQAEQKKYIGNAVEVNMARVICQALCGKLHELNSEIIAA